MKLRRLGRDDLKLTDMGAPLNARMGLNTWATAGFKAALEQLGKASTAGGR